MLLRIGMRRKDTFRIRTGRIHKRNPRILVVDDFEPTRFLMRAYLQNEGWQLDFRQRQRGVRTSRRTPPGFNLYGYRDAGNGRLRSRLTNSGVGEITRPMGRANHCSTAHIQCESEIDGIWTSYLQKPISKIQLLECLKRYAGAKQV